MKKLFSLLILLSLFAVKTHAQKAQVKYAQAIAIPVSGWRLWPDALSLNTKP